jgi:hypothetical protein
MNSIVDENGQPVGQRPGIVSIVRKWVGLSGLLGIGCVVASVAMMSWSLSRGVHCPECNRFQIADGFPWWSAFFELKNSVLAIGAMLGLAAAIGGKPRRYGLVALAGAALAFVSLTFR